MALPDVTNLTIVELKSLREVLDDRLKSLAMEELTSMEERLNDLRELAGMKRKATSAALSTGRKKASAAKGK